MKKILIALALLIGTTAFAQEKDVTTFLGIPIDGFKSDMIQKLKEKGFTPSAYRSDILEGEFNGEDVNVYIVTNNNKVYRIMVCDKNTRGETDIRIRFNNLCYQFEKKPRYIKISDKEYSIPEDEKIGYNMKVNDKRYEAMYYQIQVDTLSLVNKARTTLLQKYTEEQLQNPTDEIAKEIAFESMCAVIDAVSNKQVWFMISEYKGEYHITMYYDNVLNQANGEDL